MREIIIYLFLFLSISSLAQTNTIGLLYNNENVSEGYTLFSPHANNNSYLIDNCGNKINEWEFTEKPGSTVYLLNNGNILRAGKQLLEIRDWNNNLVWMYDINSNGFNQHHDIEPLPNGNILCIIADNYSKDTIVSLGRDSLETEDIFKLDKIIEIEPIGTNDANIVWEWKFFDRLIQNVNPTLSNYSDIETHPELLDINFLGGFNEDFIHLNGIDYNANLDQIAISARNTSEIYIIDHSTTTNEASSHTGGNSGKGGDFLWRWGNLQVYKNGTHIDQQLFNQHDVKWIPTGFLDEGKISVFNNGGDGNFDYSAVHIISPSLNGYNYDTIGNKFLPLDYFWTWYGDVLGDTIIEPKQSGCHFLENGNFIVCETSKGQFSEFDRNGEHLWTYNNPVGDTIYSQYDIVSNTTFRAEKYSINHPSFIGHDLEPEGIFENINILSDSCAFISDTTLTTDNSKIINENFPTNHSFVNPVLNQSINFIKYLNNCQISIYNLNGILILRKADFTGKELEINNNIAPSVYFLEILKDGKRDISKVIIN